MDYREILQLIFNEMPYSKKEKDIYCQMKGILGFYKVSKTDLAERYGIDKKRMDEQYKEAARKIENSIRTNYHLYA